MQSYQHNVRERSHTVVAPSKGNPEDYNQKTVHVY
jgi:hypothetical protein